MFAHKPPPFSARSHLLSNSVFQNLSSFRKLRPSCPNKPSWTLEDEIGSEIYVSVPLMIKKELPEHRTSFLPSLSVLPKAIWWLIHQGFGSVFGPFHATIQTLNKSLFPPRVLERHHSPLTKCLEVVGRRMIVRSCWHRRKIWRSQPVLLFFFFFPPVSVSKNVVTFPIWTDDFPVFQLVSSFCSSGKPAKTMSRQTKTTTTTRLQ